MTLATPPGFVDFAVALLEASHRSLKRATDGLPDDRLFAQPAPHTNSIGWMAWHLSRWKDRFAAMIASQPQVWVSQGWHTRFGIDPERTGLGDTLEQVAAFRVDPALLFGYVEAAHRATVAAVSGISAEDLAKPLQYVPTIELRPTLRLFIATAMDFTQHTGQIAYVRGLISGPGWNQG